MRQSFFPISIALSAMLAGCGPKAPPPPDYAKAHEAVAARKADCASSTETLREYAVCYANVRQAEYAAIGAPVEFLTLIGNIDAYTIELAASGRPIEEIRFMAGQYEREAIAQFQQRIAEAEAQERQRALLASSLLLQQGIGLQQPSQPLRTTCVQQGVFTNCTTN